LPVRLGSYGDPAAVPRHVWDDVCGSASGWTGYTHQWRDGFALADLCMASTESSEGTDHAASLGWRAFQITPRDTEGAPEGAIVCPHHATGGRITCNVCRRCDGSARGADRPHVVNPVHGASWRRSLPIVQPVTPRGGASDASR
jgi:hypothetical protein